jgi:hypothetical protein
MQQMVKQAMQPQPAGIEGLPSNIRMAEGGVVGFAGDEFGSYVSDPAAIAMDEVRSAEFQRKRREDYQRQKAANEEYRANIARQKQEEQQRAQVEFLEQSQAGGAAGEAAAALRRQMTTSSPQVDFRDSRYRTTELRKGEEGVAEKIGPAPLNKKPEIQFLTAQPATGIAQLAAPTQDRSKVDTAGGAFLDEARKREANRRKIAAEKEAAIKGMPDLNEQGIAALKRAEEERRRLLGVDQSDDSRRRWAGIFRGWGGDRDAYDRILTGIANRDAAANQAQLNFDQAQLKLREAQQAKALGQFDRAEKLEAEIAELYDKANTNKLQAQQIEASLASNKYATDASIYNTKVTDAAKTADRIQQARLERIRKATANQPGETERIFAEYTRRKAVDPKDAEAYLANIERIKGLGRGMDLKETSVELRALKDEQQDQLERLKSAMTDSQRKPILDALDKIAQRRRELMGAPPAAWPSLPQQAVSQLKEGVVTKFANGQQWTLRNGQPTQVK